MALIHKNKRLPVLRIMIFLLILLTGPPASANDVIELEVRAADYRIIEKEQGQLIRMDGFGYLMVPGKPLLPAKNVLIALPPGARVLSAEVIGINGTELPGEFDIMPSSPIMPLTDSKQNQDLFAGLPDEWEENRISVYSEDLPYPAQQGKLAGRGTLRKYSYASVAFYPFSYLPKSGKLIYYDAARIRITIDESIIKRAKTSQLEMLMTDDLADQQASQLFTNYAEMSHLYDSQSDQFNKTTQNYDYIILTSNTLVDAIDSSEFIDWKSSLGYNPKTILITDPEIINQSGADLAEQIRNFLREYYVQWGIEYMLIVGDIETIPMRLCYPDANVHSYNPGDPWNPGGGVPTDYYYADLSYDDDLAWDSDGDGFYGEYAQDSPDFMPEIYVGRIPTSDTSRISYTLNKLVSFEQDMGDWKNRALHGGAILFLPNEDYSGYPVVDGARCVDGIENDLMAGWIVSHFSEQEGLTISEYDWPQLNMTSFENEWREGQFSVVNWSGHGSPAGAGRIVWVTDDGDGVPEMDGSDGMANPGFISDWSNLDDDFPSIVFAISCNVGYPEPNPVGNLGVNLLTKPGFGAAAGVLSASRSAAVAVYWDSIPSGTEAICYEFNRRMMGSPDEPGRVGKALYDAKFYCNLNYAWDHRFEYLNLFDYNLYGDPSMIRAGTQALVCGDANCDETVNVGDAVFLINYVFKNGIAPEPLKIGDCNTDCAVNVGDAVYLINYVFKNGDPPQPGCADE
ncbi:MAG: hypothetical protein GY841_08035 [FCB group bacterium]|nr:hypothetical protein [FCB group bacterium]